MYATGLCDLGKSSKVVRLPESDEENQVINNVGNFKNKSLHLSEIIERRRILESYVKNICNRKS